MSHIHWVTRQNKLETPKEKDEVNKREVHECDGRVRKIKLTVSSWPILIIKFSITAITVIENLWSHGRGKVMTKRVVVRVVYY